MKYFTPRTLKFFEHLAGHNHKDWFDENRERYHESVKNPFDSYLKDLIAEVQKDDPSVQIEPKHAKFRINRDIRFSKDKTPYKTYISWIVSKWGRKDMIHPGIYMHFGHDWVHFWSGCYSPNKEHLQAIRSAISSQPKKVSTLLADPKLKNIFWDIKWEKNKRIPLEFRKKAEKIPLLFNKQFYFYTKYSEKEMMRDDLIQFTMEHWFAVKSRNNFIKKALSEFL